eukprot:Clim_evm30s6 gene=Clim_evmTU30s6
MVSFGLVGALLACVSTAAGQVYLQPALPTFDGVTAFAKAEIMTAMDEKWRCSSFGDAYLLLKAMKADAGVNDKDICLYVEALAAGASAEMELTSPGSVRNFACLAKLSQVANCGAQTKGKFDIDLAMTIVPAEGTPLSAMGSYLDNMLDAMVGLRALGHDRKFSELMGTALGDVESAVKSQAVTIPAVAKAAASIVDKSHASVANVVKMIIESGSSSAVDVAFTGGVPVLINVLKLTDVGTSKALKDLVPQICKVLSVAAGAKVSGVASIQALEAMAGLPDCIVAGAVTLDKKSLSVQIIDQHAKPVKDAIIEVTGSETVKFKPDGLGGYTAAIPEGSVTITLTPVKGKTKGTTSTIELTTQQVIDISNVKVTVSNLNPFTNEPTDTVETQSLTLGQKMESIPVVHSTRLLEVTFDASSCKGASDYAHGILRFDRKGAKQLTGGGYHCTEADQGDSSVAHMTCVASFGDEIHRSAIKDIDDVYDLKLEVGCVQANAYTEREIGKVKYLGLYTAEEVLERDPYAPKPMQKHTFPPPQKRASSAIIIAFIAAVSLPFVILIGYILPRVANLNLSKMGLAGSVALAGIIGYNSYVAYYWFSLTIFEAMQLLLPLFITTFFMLNVHLGDLSKSP